MNLEAARRIISNYCIDEPPDEELAVRRLMNHAQIEYALRRKVLDGTLTFEQAQSIFHRLTDHIYRHDKADDSIENRIRYMRDSYNKWN